MTGGASIPAGGRSCSFIEPHLQELRQGCAQSLCHQGLARLGHRRRNAAVHLDRRQQAHVHLQHRISGETSWPGDKQNEGYTQQDTEAATYMSRPRCTCIKTSRTSPSIVPVASPSSSSGNPSATKRIIAGACPGGSALTTYASRFRSLFDMHHVCLGQAYLLARGCIAPGCSEAMAHGGASCLISGNACL